MISIENAKAHVERCHTPQSGLLWLDPSLVMAYDLLGFNVTGSSWSGPIPCKRKNLADPKNFDDKTYRESERERVTEGWRRSGGEKWRQWHQWVFRLQQYFLQLRSSGYAPFCLSLLMENSVRVFVGYLFCSLLFVFGLLLTLLGIELHLLFGWLSSVKCPILFESSMDWNLSLSCALSHLTHLHFF